jgi:probable HAF family extracellular repeat protein
MFQQFRSLRRRNLRPSLDCLEGRALLNGAMPTMPMEGVNMAMHVQNQHNGPGSMMGGPSITILNTPSAGGYQFLNHDGPNPGTNAGAGTNLNGISNAGTAVGFTIDNNGNFANFTTNPMKSRMAGVLNINGSMKAMAFGINSAGTVVGTDGNGNAFELGRRGGVKTFIPNGAMSATAFGINDQGAIVGQYVTSTATPGFVMNGKSVVTINAPSGPNTVNAQGINNKGQVVGFYVGTDGQDHGFMANANVRAGKNAMPTITGTAISDPTIPSVPGEPGATFVFSQILGINDKGIAVGYYGDSTTSQHGFLYNTHTGTYTFLDDPSEAFNNGVEVTQITGITNSGEITGFYSDANGVFHGFVANPQQF